MHLTNSTSVEEESRDLRLKDRFKETCNSDN